MAALWKSDGARGRGVIRSVPWRLGAATALALLLSATLMVAVAIQGQRIAGDRASARGEATVDTLLRLETILELTLVAENGQRGYLLTGEPESLAAYERAIGRLPVALDETSARLAAGGDPQQVARFATVRRAIESKLLELSETLAMHEAGHDEAMRALVRSRLSRELAEQVQAVIGTMRRIEQRARAVSRGEADRARDRLAMLVGLAIALLVAVAALTAWLGYHAARDLTLRTTLDSVRAERDRVDLLRRELSHRIKNLFAITSSIVSATARETPGDTRETVAAIRARIDALGRAHALSLGEADGERGAVGMAQLLRSVAGAYADAPEQLRISGNAAATEESITPIGLIVNELATNARKYGGFSRPSAHVEARIAGQGANGFSLDWIEFCASGPERIGASEGFGTRLLDTALQQLGATIDRQVTEAGIAVRIVVPRQHEGPD
ncbi:CHASE3 domain-containing protein [Jannaschia sp. W003]|uniref:CHASE3 domain-containing protein n=1 Tax=Jannaschia sp. W003 TaxID=2867012 RepID=UPI0021A3AA97|nr:CHASE3 domain-containing protein [Jannaschia sp. W003]UWQ21358.1 CHASE3 domain-containing protein [Jannaschia sp. W003]